MIYISYGITKSASTFVYELTQGIFRAAGRTPVALSADLKGSSPENYIDPITGSALEAIRREVVSADAIIKTHGAPDSRVLEELETKNLLASAVIRDPREIALAMVDHGKRSRESGVPAFIEIEKPLDAISSIKMQLERFFKWTASNKVLVFTYDEVCFETELVIDRIARQIDTRVDPTPILKMFSNKSAIGQFNKGIEARYKEMDKVTDGIFLEEFNDFYIKYKFATQSASSIRNHAVRGETLMTRADVIFLQTADQDKYKVLLELTSRSVVEYCSKHKYGYESFLGICRGYYPWQATYNRIPLLRRIVDSGFRGWVCYLDADAFIVDLDFDLGGYLSDKGHLAFIAATDRRSDPERPYWFVNAGTFLVNLASEMGRAIVYKWADQFDALTDQQLKTAEGWNQLPNDQDMLQQVLRDLPDAKEHTLTLRGTSVLINYDTGKFIRQILRGNENIQKRIEQIRTEIDRVLCSSSQMSNVEFPGARRVDEHDVEVCYRTLLGRPPESDAVVYRHLQSTPTLQDFLERIIDSSEFRSKYAREN